MTDDITIYAENLGKMYLLYNQPIDRLKQSLFGRLGKNYAHIFWALRNVSFSVRQGQAIGIIGRNGSGKSTLLQILAGTLQHTEGRFQVNGRLAALLELGAGFNPEFTGRENIFLNGATLGFSEKEMRRQVDAIIDFAQIGEFIDQPVKIYSSGMFVRLAFSIATCVEPEILIIDEALAVGDAGFVIKCMNRMKEMRAKGTTIVLVTHDVQTVRSFCDVALWLHEGTCQAFGSPLDITGRYLQFLFESQNRRESPQEQAKLSYQQPSAIPSESRSMVQLDRREDLVRWGSGEIQIEGCTMDNGLGEESLVFEYGQSIHIEMAVRALQDIPSSEIGFGFAFRNTKGLDIITSTTHENERRVSGLRRGQMVRVSFDLENILSPGTYALVLNVENRDQALPQYYDFVENALIFTVVSKKPIYSLVLPNIDQNIEISND